MPLPSVFHNLAGTFKSAFRIGREGPTLRQGTSDPNASAVFGLDGDIYIQHDIEEKIFQRRNGVWLNIGGEGFTRTAVTTPSYTVQPTDYYIGINYAGPVTIQLPAGVTNKQFIIKDESGLANGSDRLITVLPEGEETIDGQEDLLIVAGYTSLTLVFGNEWHLI